LEKKINPTHFIVIPSSRNVLMCRITGGNSRNWSERTNENAQQRGIPVVQTQTSNSTSIIRAIYAHVGDRWENNPALKLGIDLM
jgi:hypothetical protein